MSKNSSKGKTLLQLHYKGKVVKIYDGDTIHVVFPFKGEITRWKIISEIKFSIRKLSFRIRIVQIFHAARAKRAKNSPKPSLKF